MSSVLQEILTRSAAGDPAAKKALIERSHGRLMVIARGLLNQFPAARREEESAGVVNEAYLRLNTALDDVRPATPRQYFGLVALQIRRVLLDLVRKLGPRDRKGALRPVVLLLRPREGGGHDPADSAIGPDDVEQDVRAAIERLSDEEWEAVDLIFFNGLTQAEAAEELGVSEDTVKRRWARARIVLGGALAGYGPNP
jgi:RNA polymerase sigma-70 factor (ECF subfamily)